MSTVLLIVVVRIGDEILPRFQTPCLLNYQTEKFQKAICSRKSRHLCHIQSCKSTPQPLTGLGAHGPGPAAARRVSFWAWNCKESRDARCRSGAAVIAGLFRWSRRCRSKTRQQWLVGYIYHYLYSHCNLFLVHSGEKSAWTLPDPYIMNSQSRSRTAPPPSFLALNSREWRGLTYASVEEADHQCWLVGASSSIKHCIFSYLFCWI